jgi:DNA-binding NarL/FixJ family response regulator
MAPPRRSSAPPTRVVIVDDHRSFAQSLRAALSVERGIEVAAVCHDGQAAADVVRRTRPQVVLMDLVMPGMDGVAATRSVLDKAPDARVLILSAQEGDDLLARAVDAGAVGFLSKTAPVKDIARAVRDIARGASLLSPEEVRRLRSAARKRREQAAAMRERVARLSRRETEILQMMADGVATDDVARELGITANTLRTHMQNILFKLKVHSKVEALAAAIRYGKVRVEPEG